MPNPLEKIIELVRKTGDNCVVLDAAGDPAYVLVSFDRYQKMAVGKTEIAQLTEEELLDKVNQDIAAWKASHDGEEFSSWPTLESAEVGVKKAKNAAGEDKKSLNQAKKDPVLSDSTQDYFFEPVE